MRDTEAGTWTVETNEAFPTLGRFSLHTLRALDFTIKNKEWGEYSLTT